MDRREAIAKATTTTSVAAGGLLNPSQSSKFLETVKESSTFGKAIRTETVPTPTGELNKLATASRLLRASHENTDDGYRAQPTFPTVAYETVEKWLPFEVTEQTFEENIEKEALEAKLLKQFGAQFALDLDDLDINGDTGSGNAFIQIQDGVIEQIDNDAAVHDVDGSAINGGALALAHFFAAKRAIPNKYINGGNLRWFMSPLKASEWVEALTARATAAGDTAIGGTSPLATAPLGIPILGTEDGNPGLSFWPDTRVVLANPKNFIRAIFRDIIRQRVTGETDWELATRRKRGYVFHIREGVLIEEGDAVVNLHTMDV